MIYWLVLTLSACGPAATAQTFAHLFEQEMFRERPAFSFQKHVLANGLTVLLYKDSARPVISTNIYYKVGSKNEKAGKTGFAHLFEHYMFECSEYFEEDELRKRIEDVCGGSLNASTSHDSTRYVNSVPTGCMDELLRLESARMGFLQKCIVPKLLDKQRKIVSEELRQREMRPYHRSFDLTRGQVFQPGHPYHWPVIGYLTDLGAATTNDVGDFWKTYYLPNNAVLAIAGDLDYDQALARVRFWFEGIPRGPAPPPFNAPRVDSLGGRREATETDEKVHLPMLVLAYPIPGRGQPGAREAEALASILAAGKGSRLEKALRYGPRPLVVGIGAGNVSLHESDMLIIQAIPVAGVSLEQLEAAIVREIDALATGGIRPEELARIKTRMRTAYYNALQDLGGIADAMAEGEALASDPEAFLDGEVRAINALTPQAIQAVAAQRLRPDNVAVTKIVPPQGAPR